MWNILKHYPTFFDFFRSYRTDRFIWIFSSNVHRFGYGYIIIFWGKIGRIECSWLGKLKNLSHFTCRLLGYSYPNASFIRIQQPLDPLLKKLDLKTQRKYEAFL